MPNIWTHILFCEESADLLERPDAFLQHETAMKLGAQGPDPFFYYRFWPWAKENTVNQIGLILHQQKCGDFLMDLIERAKNRDGQVRAFVFGFITHHILDRNTHPYIHYRAGYEGNNHQKLEVTIDTLMMAKYHNLKTWRSQVNKEMDTGREFHAIIGKLLAEAIAANYPSFSEQPPQIVQKTYRDMFLALKLLADPYGWKNKLLKPFVSPYSHQPVEDDKDYLNLNHQTWHHPATNEPCSKSFIDLYNQAKTETIEIMTDLIVYWHTGDTAYRERVSERIGNISYDTGKPLSQNLQNRYSDPII
ncbi:hypothetical protein EU245_08675 [Lentibacillus lipolyticus]|nr:hypothetical protein EU245_08675 [Lentibacillus lipolyticus]